MMQMTDTVKQLLIINIIFYIGAHLTAPMSYDLFAMHFPLSNDFQWWQPLTHMFMHAQMPNLMHIVFNMFGLVMFGSALEHFWGGKKFIFFYISCGLGAALVHTGMNYYEFQKGLEFLSSQGFSNSEVIGLLHEGKYNDVWKQLMSESQFNDFMSSYFVPAVGASGALYGILVAFAFMFPNAELMLLFIPIPIKAKYFVTVLVLYDFIMGMTGSSVFGGGGIAHFAHVGGALTGFLMMWYWKKNQFNKNRWN
jgi:membrane associated rhomboid family serine protease